MIHSQSIVVLDFGGQYAHLIASRIRRFGSFSAILPPETPAKELEGVAGIILSGGPQSVYENGSPQADPKLLDLGVPVLGLCYGHQWIAHVLGGEVRSGKVKEYGHTEIQVMDKNSSLFKGLPHSFIVWMSHGDEVTKLPKGFSRIANTEVGENAAMADEKRKIFGLQFHVEVAHTENGIEILRRFVDLCKPAPWSVESYAKHVGDQVKREVGDNFTPLKLREERKVFMLVSGGVDSTVTFTLLNKVLGPKRVKGLLVDTGLMRLNEVKDIQRALRKLGIKNLHVEDASEEFFRNLQDVYDPEEKRKVIGNTFLDVQRRISEDMGVGFQAGWMLGQGTIYPDTIEAGGTKHADRIKTHHNRVEAMRKLIDQGLVIEPLKELYKDEVRKLGLELGLPHELVWRHPFPGPGLGVRILCAREPAPVVEIPNSPPSSASGGLRRAGKSHIPNKFKIPIPYQVLPIRSVGVQGDNRTYRHAVALFGETLCAPTKEMWKLATTIPNAHEEFNRVLLCTSHIDPVAFSFTPGYLTKERADLLREADHIVDREMRKAGLYEKIWQFPVVLLPVGMKSGGQSIVLRPVESQEAMTANAAHLPEDVLRRMTERMRELPGIDLVFLDMTNKPPGTIEWE